jgi:hypothetical protein
MASYSIGNSPILADKNEQGESKIETPVSSLTAAAFGAFNDIKNIFSGANKVEYSSQIEVTGGKR